MSRYSTYPYLFDEEKFISTTNLLKWGYLREHSLRSGTITWSINGNETSSIGINVKINEYQAYLMVNYKCNETDYNYKILLDSIPSNLGNGKIWFFICPFTFKRCRKLHLINERFMHRSNLPSGMYSIQTESKNWRLMSRVYGSSFKLDGYYEEIYSKHFKTHYKGKPTKRYVKLMKQISLAERISHEDIENLLIINKNSN